MVGLSFVPGEPGRYHAQKIMSLDRFQELNSKQIAGTITDAEHAEFQAILHAHAKTRFSTCPACKGAFSPALTARSVCPQCETSLTHFAADLSGHKPPEIDSTIEPMQSLGVFCEGYALPGTVPCVQCGTTYPKNYECCPRLFLTALEMITSGDQSNRQVALQFLDSNSATLLNALRGGFSVQFEKPHRKQLKKLATELTCGNELRDVLEDA